MARASGSYPEGHRFKSRCRYQTGNGFIPSYGPVVKRSRHRPFTAVTRVRFSSGSPKQQSDKIGLLFFSDMRIELERVSVLRKRFGESFLAESGEAGTERRALGRRAISMRSRRSILVRVTKKKSRTIVWLFFLYFSLFIFHSSIFINCGRAGACPRRMVT